MIQKINNWFIKQRFYWNYFMTDKADNSLTASSKNMVFHSITFGDGHWNRHLPWDDESKKTNWNTYYDPDQSTVIPGFLKRYGKFNFLSMLNGSTTDGRPAIWLLEIRDEDDVNPKLLAFNGSNYYYEIDIEMWKEKFGYTIHVNHNGKQYDKLSGYCQCGSYYRDKSLLRDLRRGFHLHTIDWQYDYVRFYIDGLLTAKFKNEMHLPMQIIMSKLEIGKVLVTK